MYKSSTAKYWFNFRGHGDVGVKNKRTQEKLWSNRASQTIRLRCTTFNTAWLHFAYLDLSCVHVAGVEASDSPRGWNQLLFSVFLGWVPCFRLCHFRMLRKCLQSDGNHTQIPTFLCNNPPNKMPERLHCFFWFFFLRTHSKTTFEVPPRTAAQWHVPPVIAFKMFRQKLSLTLRTNSMTIKLYLYMYYYIFSVFQDFNGFKVS